MSDIINIVMHPGYCVNQDNYNKEIYFEQLDKGLVNIFLHPTLSERQMEFLLNKEFFITKKNALNGLNINSNLGSKIRFAIKTLIITTAVKRPKYIVGTRFESIKIENPITTIIVV